MDLLIVYDWLRTVHIGGGFLGLVVFWLPLLVRKGNTIHVICGRIFVVSATVALASVSILCGWRLIDPIHSFPAASQPAAEHAADFVRQVRLIYAFLGALAVFTFVTLFLAVRVIHTRHDPSRLSEHGGRLLVWSQIIIGAALILFASVLWIQKPDDFLCSIPIGAGLAGVGSAWWDLRFLASPRTSEMFWWYKHMEFILRTGIAFHTAFAVFVLTPWFGQLGAGAWSLVPWVAPSIVGIPAVWLWIRHYQQKFEAPART